MKPAPPVLPIQTQRMIDIVVHAVLVFGQVIQWLVILGHVVDEQPWLWCRLAWGDAVPAVGCVEEDYQYVSSIWNLPEDREVAPVDGVVSEEASG